MSIKLVASVLGKGVEIAALTPYAELEKILETRESISETIGTSENFATYQILAIQLVENHVVQGKPDHSGKCIELRISASDGCNELVAYYYSPADD